MQIFKTVQSLQAYLAVERQSGKKIGFAPTMGALHEGHLSLLRQSQLDNDLSVCSIFVNPTQFNENSDLEKYPRTPEQDQNLLEHIDTDVLFMPSVKEVYPPNQATTTFEFGDLETVMEGKFRPGHFKGVAQVVKRLLDIVQPDSLYMGQKDFQQFAIIQNMLQQLNSSIKIVSCPIVREKDGLAMSSRNLRLTEEHREKAVLVYETLKMAKDMLPTHHPKDIQAHALKQLNIDGFNPEYFEIVDTVSLQAVESFHRVGAIVACTAVWAGQVRLIDNMILKKITPNISTPQFSKEASFV